MFALFVRTQKHHYIRSIIWRHCVCQWYIRSFQNSIRMSDLNSKHCDFCDAVHETSSDFMIRRPAGVRTETGGEGSPCGSTGACERLIEKVIIQVVRLRVTAHREKCGLRKSCSKNYLNSSAFAEAAKKKNRRASVRGLLWKKPRVEFKRHALSCRSDRPSIRENDRIGNANHERGQKLWTGSIVGHVISELGLLPLLLLGPYNTSGDEHAFSCTCATRLVSWNVYASLQCELMFCVL